MKRLLGELAEQTGTLLGASAGPVHDDQHGLGHVRDRGNTMNPQVIAVRGTGAQSKVDLQIAFDDIPRTRQAGGDAFCAVAYEIFPEVAQNGPLMAAMKQAVSATIPAVATSWTNITGACGCRSCNNHVRQDQPELCLVRLIETLYSLVVEFSHVGYGDGPNVPPAVEGIQLLRRERGFGIKIVDVAKRSPMPSSRSLFQS